MSFVIFVAQPQCEFVEDYHKTCGYNIVYLYNILGVSVRRWWCWWSCLGVRGLGLARISSRRLQLYDVMDATDRTAQWRARSSRLRLGPIKMEEPWWIANEAD